MLDTLRADDTVSRDSRSRLREVRGAVQHLEHRLGRAPRAKEVANELNWTLEKFHSTMVDAGAGGRRSQDVDLEHPDDPPYYETDGADQHIRIDDASATDPAHALQRRQRHAVLSAAFDALEEAERYVMESIYDKDLALRTIGDTLGVSDARVSQIRSEIVAKLKRRLRDT